MLKKTCPNGHVYDQNIYGDICPLCAQTAATRSEAEPEPTGGAPGAIPGAHTKVVPRPQSAGGDIAVPGLQPELDPTGPTKLSARFAAQQDVPRPKATPGKTVIRHNPAVSGGARVTTGETNRKLVGFLVTYNRTPMGQAFNIYEGRNVIGRDASCDISIPDDNQLSGKHMSIRYLSGNNKFRFHDEMSSNGTYVNKELLDDGELQNYDIIRVGSTLFIFLAIPQI